MSLRRQLTAGAIVARASLTLFERPDRLPRAMLAIRPWGATLAGIVAAAAARYPERVAVHDEHGPTSYDELWRRAQSVAAGLADAGVGVGSRVGLLCRNHRGFVEALAAVSAIGADVVLLNTGFAGPQLADVVEHEGVTLVIHDHEFADVVAGCGVDTLDESAVALLATAGRAATPQRTQGRVVILTSGTTGRPKGAERRSDPAAIEGVAALLERVPFRLGDTQVIAAPLFHAWGLTNLLLGLARCTTNVLARDFD
ncbi:MAG: AMP-binding protein, partial [Ilumatobacteraceae bacterium]